MANSSIKTPFKDRIAPGAVPKRGTTGGEYDSERNLPGGIPMRDTSPNGVPELYRDTAITKGAAMKQPEPRGMVKTPFKDAVD